MMFKRSFQKTNIQKYESRTDNHATTKTYIAHTSHGETTFTFGVDVVGIT